MTNPTSKLDLVVNGVTTSYDIHDANAIPRSGGAVITGNSLGKNVDNGSIDICGGTNRENGAFLALRGKNNSNEPGYVVLGAKNGTDSSSLILTPNGTATWGGKNIDCVEEQGSFDNEYIRYSSGIQICWGYVNAGIQTTITFPKSFSIRPSVSVTVDSPNLDSMVTATCTAQAVTVYNNVEYHGGFYIAIGRWK